MVWNYLEIPTGGSQLEFASSSSTVSIYIFWRLSKSNFCLLLTFRFVAISQLLLFQMHRCITDYCYYSIGHSNLILCLSSGQIIRVLCMSRWIVYHWVVFLWIVRISICIFYVRSLYVLCEFVCDRLLVLVCITLCVCARANSRTDVCMQSTLDLSRHKSFWYKKKWLSISLAFACMRVCCVNLDTDTTKCWTSAAQGLLNACYWTLRVYIDGRRCKIPRTQWW